LTPRRAKRISGRKPEPNTLMPDLDKKALSERDICTKFITPSLTGAHWDVMSQIREEVSFTKGRVIVRGKLSTRGEPKRADYVLSHKPGIPLLVLEAKDNNHSVGAGMQPALDIAARGYNLDVKNPHAADDAHQDPAELLAEYQKAQAAVAEVREKLRRGLESALLRP
jgi:hypothetical protein